MFTFTLLSSIFLGPVIAVDASSIQNDILVATSSTDRTIKIWKSCCDHFEFKCFQTISLSYQFCFAVKLFIDPSQSLLLFSEGEKLQLWAQQFENNFCEVLTMPGHGDWIRSIDAIINEQNIMILTGSQDYHARIWKLSLKRSLSESIQGVIHNEEKLVNIKNNTFSVSLESVISGHEGIVYSANFFKRNGEIGIMTCSIDKSIIIWYQGEDGVWMDTHRIGEMGGGNLGFLGAKIALNGKAIVAHGFQGSLHIWTTSPGRDGDIIKRERAPTGHFGGVNDIAWAPGGDFIFSISSDQTTRIHAPCKSFGEVKWCEIGRAQIHGYDLTSIAVLSPYMIATGAEEKVIRIFNTTERFIGTLKAVSSKENSVCDNEIPTKSKKHISTNSSSFILKTQCPVKVL